MLTLDQFFRALSDRNRLDCLMLLVVEERLCVCEFVHALEIPQTRISRHLGHLRDIGIVQDERRRQWVHYRLHPALPAWALEILNIAAQEQMLTSGPVRDRLAAMARRPSIDCD